MFAALLFAEHNIGGRDGQLAADGHGIARVDRQVHDHLLGLSGVGLYPAQVGRKLGVKMHVFSQQPAQKPLHGGDNLVEFKNLGRQHLLAAEGQ